jgi:hypothetical protein
MGVGVAIMDLAVAVNGAVNGCCCCCCCCCWFWAPTRG